MAIMKQLVEVLRKFDAALFGARAVIGRLTHPRRLKPREKPLRSSSAASYPNAYGPRYLEGERGSWNDRTD